MMDMSLNWRINYMSMGMELFDNIKNEMIDKFRQIFQNNVA